MKYDSEEESYATTAERQLQGRHMDMSKHYQNMTKEITIDKSQFTTFLHCKHIHKGEKLEKAHICNATQALQTTRDLLK